MYAYFCCAYSTERYLLSEMYSSKRVLIFNSFTVQIATKSVRFTLGVWLLIARRADNVRIGTETHPKISLDSQS